MINGPIGSHPGTVYTLYTVRVSCMYDVPTMCPSTDFCSMIPLLVLWSQAFRWGTLATNPVPLWLHEVVKTCSLLIITTPCWAIRCISVYTQTSQVQKIAPRGNVDNARPGTDTHVQPSLTSTNTIHAQEQAAKTSDVSLLRTDVNQVQNSLEQSSRTSTDANCPSERQTLPSEIEMNAIGKAV